MGLSSHFPISAHVAPYWCTRNFFFSLMHPIGPELPISAHVACTRVCRQLYVLRASHALVQATVGVGTVINVYIGVAYTGGGGVPTCPAPGATYGSATSCWRGGICIGKPTAATIRKPTLFFFTGWHKVDGHVCSGNWCGNTWSLSRPQLTITGGGGGGGWRPGLLHLTHPKRTNPMGGQPTSPSTTKGCPPQKAHMCIPPEMPPGILLQRETCSVHSFWCCFMKALLFYSVAGGGEHHWCIRRACGRAAESKICDHPLS